jgi:hypothetical protein
MGLTDMARVHETASAGQYPTLMTRRDREDLAKLCRQREKLAKHQVEAHKAALKADFERKLAAVYSFDQNDIWAKAAVAASAATKAAQQTIAAECQRLGIPKEFAPSIHTNWYGRGENAVPARRAELRKVADSKIEAMARDAKFRIEQFSLETQTKLLAGGLESADAKAFLESMPTAAQLMPAMDFKDIDAATPKRLRGDVEDDEV